MLPDYKKETLNDWVDRFIKLMEEKFESGVFNFTPKEREFFGNAFNISLFEDQYLIDVFFDGLAYTKDSTLEEIKQGIKELVEKHRIEYENIVKFLVSNRSHYVQNVDFLDLTIENDKASIGGCLSILYPKESKVILNNKEYTIDEYVKEFNS